MVMSCCVIGCFTKQIKGVGIGFHRFPVDDNRKALWIRSIKRGDWEPLKQSAVCRKHFQTGKPRNDPNHPDFVPNVLLPLTPQKNKIDVFRDISNTDFQVATSSISQITSGQNKKRKVARKSKKQYKDVGTSTEDFQAVPTSYSQNSSVSGQSSEKRNQSLVPTVYSYVNGKFIALQDENEKIKLAALQEANDKLKKQIEEMKKEMQENAINSTLEMHFLRNDVKNLTKKFLLAHFPSHVLQNTKQLTLFTGVHTRDGFDWILCISKKYITQSFSIPEGYQLLIVLIKLRMALCDEDIAVRFGVYRRTVRRVLNAWLPVLSSRLKYLVAWPKRKMVKKLLPSCFANSMYEDAMCIIDCTNIKTQRPSNMKTRNKMWSNYKQHLTVKFLVAITPQGHICYISKSFSGRATDKEITLKSNLINHLLPGDMVLADKGFNITSDLQAHGIRVIVPAYTRGQNQLPNTDVMKSCRISNVRIHIEKVIGYMKRFKILSNTLPINSLKYVDSFITISGALNNLWPGTVL